MNKVKHFFSSPLRSSLFTLFAALLVVLAVFITVRESNKLISFEEAVEISMKDMGYDYFENHDGVTLLKGSIDCYADESKYYKVILRADDGFDHAYFVWAKSGEIIGSTKEKSEGLAIDELPPEYDTGEYDYNFNFFK